MIKERYQLMLRTGEPQLHVIVPKDPTSDLRVRLERELKMYVVRISGHDITKNSSPNSNHIPYFPDPYRNSLVLTVPQKRETPGPLS